MILSKSNPISYPVYSFLISIVLFAIISCSGEKQDKKPVNLEEEVGSKNSEEVFEQVKRIFYSLPSPIETAMVIRQTGAIYNPEFMNPIENAERYQDNNSMAINLGIYSADLSYSSLFEQPQLALKYMSVTKKMADRIGILNAINAEDVQELEKNIDNPEFCISIISDTFMKSNAYLKENERPEIAALIVLGGWIEALYLATRLTNQSMSENPELINKIAEQRHSLNNVLGLLSQHAENREVQKLSTEITLLKKEFDKINVATTKVVPVKNEEEGVTLLKSKETIDFPPEVFENIYTLSGKIRNRVALNNR